MGVHLKYYKYNQLKLYLQYVKMPKIRKKNIFR